MSEGTLVRFGPAAAPVTEPVTKLGGDPVWLAEPQWPLSRRLRAPMRFLGQVALPGPERRLAYVFMSDDDGGLVEQTWHPESGENALLVQPGGRVPPFVETVARATGPTLPRELVAEPVNGQVTPELLASRVGLHPSWLQGEEDPGPGWTFAFQLDSEDAERMINFGDAGVGYAFVSADGGEGRFLWQCA